MMAQLKDGDVVIVGSGQAGTVIENVRGSVVVLLANYDLWTGPSTQVHIPTSPEELAQAPLEVDRFEHREKRKPKKRSEARLDDY